jgi:hypothetical protein
MKLLLTMLVVVCLSGCSALSAISTLMPGLQDKGISVDAQVGDRANELALGGARGTGKIVAKGKARVTVNTSSASNKFEKAETVIINETNPWVLGGLLAAIILFIPSPLPKLLRGIKWLATIRQRTSRRGSEQKSK